MKEKKKKNNNLGQMLKFACIQSIESDVKKFHVKDLSRINYTILNTPC